MFFSPSERNDRAWPGTAPAWPVIFQFLRYAVAGGAAAAVHLLVLALLVELSLGPKTIASAIGFVCAVPVNYSLQHRFVFNRSRRHKIFVPRYLAVTLFTLGLNTALFWILSQGLGLYYLISQVITIGLIVPLNFVLNRSVTFADVAAAQALGHR